jgi:hypothetical protein
MYTCTSIHVFTNICYLFSPIYHDVLLNMGHNNINNACDVLPSDTLLFNVFTSCVIKIRQDAKSSACVRGNGLVVGYKQQSTGMSGSCYDDNCCNFYTVFSYVPTQIYLFTKYVYATESTKANIILHMDLCIAH